MPDDVRAKKREAVDALQDIEGVGGIGISWDDAGREVLRVDVARRADRNLVESRLNRLDVPFELNVTNTLTKLL